MGGKYCGRVPVSGTECVNEILANLNADGYVEIFPPDQEFKGAGAQP